MDSDICCYVTTLKNKMLSMSVDISSQQNFNNDQQATEMKDQP